jgi:hypothetical protein
MLEGLVKTLGNYSLGGIPAAGNCGESNFTEYCVNI